MIGLLVMGYSRALAADARYALSAQIVVPSDEAVRIDLPPEWVVACPDPSSYLLQDADGREVPYAVRTSDDTPPGPEALTWEPVERSPWLWTYLVHGPKSGSPTVALSVRGLPRDQVIEATVYRGEHLVTKVLLWNLPDTGAGVRDRIALPRGERSGPWRVDLHAVSSWRSRPWAEFEALTTGADQVEPIVWSVDADEPVVTGPHTSRVSMALPRSDLPVRGVRVHATDKMFSRPASIVDGRGAVIAKGELRRFLYGGATIDVDRVPVHATLSRMLSIDLEDDRSIPLAIDRVEIELRGIALLTGGGARGRWTLSGCGPAGASYDLERLGMALHRSVNERLTPALPRANTAWTASLVTEGLAGPGQPLRGRSQSLGRVMVSEASPPGLVRVPLPAALSAQIRSDLADLRLVDGEGRQLPYLSDDAGSVAVHGVTYAVSESGPTTVMQIVLPTAGLPIEQLVLYAERSRFVRNVSVRGAGKTVEMRWEGSGEEASRLIVPLSGRASSHIEVRVDNGDNAPLPLLSPDLSMGSTDLWLVLPADGAELRLLQSDIAPPRYDLSLLRSELLDGPAMIAAVALAPPTPAPPPRPAITSVVRVEEPKAPRSPAWLTAVVGICALMLGGLAHRLTRDTHEQSP